MSRVTRTPLSGPKGQRSRSPGRFGWLFKSLHDLYGRHHDHSLSIMNIHGARRAGRRRLKACRLWTGGEPLRAYSEQGGGILCRHAHSLFKNRIDCFLKIGDLYKLFGALYLCCVELS